MPNISNKRSRTKISNVTYLVIVTNHSIDALITYLHNIKCNRRGAFKIFITVMNLDEYNFDIMNFKECV